MDGRPPDIFHLGVELGGTRFLVRFAFGLRSAESDELVDVTAEVCPKGNALQAVESLKDRLSFALRRAPSAFHGFFARIGEALSYEASHQAMLKPATPG